MNRLNIKYVLKTFLDHVLLVHMIQTSNVRINFSQRLAQACNQVGMEEHGRGVILAKQLKVTPKAVSKWLNAESMPRQAKMEELAHFLNVDISWLQFGSAKAGSVIDNQKQKAHCQCSAHPILSDELAIKYAKANTFEYKDIPRTMRSAVPASSSAFWLTVSGDSMASPVGISFPEDMYILFDPSINVTHKSFVAAYLPDINKVVFRQYIRESELNFLKPLNPSQIYQSIPVDNTVVIGVATDARWKLK